MENATHQVSLGGEIHLVNPDNFKAVCDELVKKHGGVPKVEPVAAAPEVLRSGAATVVITAQPPVRGQTVDEVGKLRSLQDVALAKANGFAPAKPLYSRGTMVVELGVENARSSRLEHEKKPLVEDACRSLVQKVRAEQRSDRIEPLKDLRLTNKGELVVARIDGAGNPTSDRVGPLSENAFNSLLSLAGIGGHQYLKRVPSTLRATNVNNWLVGRDGLPVPGGQLKMRTRDSVAGGREIFATVSPGYTAFDADLVAAGVAVALEGKGARGTVDYDGFRTRIEAIYHSDVQPEDYVAGEFFKAGVIVRTDDTGGGSLRISACVWQNLCLNLIIIDEADQVVDAIRHVGDPEKMAARFAEALVVAASKVDAFRVKWGAACHDRLVEQLPTSELSAYGVGTLSLEQVIPGFFNGVIERELVPVRGKRVEVVRQLVQMHDKDQSGATLAGPTRASLVNAFTRWAHECNQDPFFADDVSRAAGALAQSQKPLPFLPIEIKG